MLSQYYEDDMAKKLEVILEERDEELKEGLVDDLAERAAKALASGAKNLTIKTAKGIWDGLTKPKEDKLMDTASQAYGELFRDAGINITDEKVKDFLSNTLLKQVAKKLEKTRQASTGAESNYSQN